MRRAVILGLVGVVLLVAALMLRHTLNRQDDIAATAPPAAPTPAPTPSQPAPAQSATAQSATAAPPATPAPPAVASVPPAPAPAPASAPSPAAAPPPAATPNPAAPSFDVVRVTPRGDAVIAGRAEPRAEVQVLDGVRVLGTVTADPRGEWVLLPNAPLASGERQLTLQAQPSGAAPGAAPIASDQVVVVVVPEASVGQRPDAAAPVALLVPRDVLAARAAGLRMVEPGDSLWELARRNYGRGLDFNAIFEANRDRISNPDLIYPGQVFVIPPNR